MNTNIIFRLFLFLLIPLFLKFQSVKAEDANKIDDEELPAMTLLLEELGYQSRKC